MSEFGIGDRVQLRSGGPIMVVEKIEERVYCVWFETRLDGEYISSPSRASFPAPTLALVNG